jgi:hypothetical protein
MRVTMPEKLKFVQKAETSFAKHVKGRLGAEGRRSNRNQQ